MTPCRKCDAKKTAMVQQICFTACAQASVKLASGGFEFNFSSPLEKKCDFFFNRALPYYIDRALRFCNWKHPSILYGHEVMKI